MTEGGIFYDRTDQTGGGCGGDGMQRAADRRICAAAGKSRMVVHGVFRCLRGNGGAVRKQRFGYISVQIGRLVAGYHGIILAATVPLWYNSRKAAILFSSGKLAANLPTEEKYEDYQ